MLGCLSGAIAARLLFSMRTRAARSCRGVFSMNERFEGLPAGESGGAGPPSGLGEKTDASIKF